MAASGVAAATLTTRWSSRLSLKSASRSHPNVSEASLGPISCRSQSWGQSPHLRERREKQVLETSFKGVAVRLVATGWKCRHSRTASLRAALPGLLLPSNIAQVAPSFLARMVGFYVLLKAGIAVPYKRDITEEEQETRTLRVTKKWKIHNNSILQRKYRASSSQDGRKKLRMICDVLSDDDTFKMSDTHKGCQVRRENAHAETVCCNSVRALYDDIPFPHIKIEISRFPEGRVGMEEYYKAEKLEQVLNSRAK